MCDIELVEASKEHESQAMTYRQRYIDLGEKEINGSSQLIKYKDYDEWLERIKSEKAIEPSLTHTPSTTYFMIRKTDDKVIGSIQLRHHLTEELKKDGGNIGYGICPSERGKDYGVRQLSLVVEKARELGLDKVMISCNKDNRASAQVAIKNGGVLAGEGFDEDEVKVTEIYWIDIV
ncbi:MAG: GNAT family N-acetyltransferase [Defluviitaleaceae bacterium]|nr:GNAT family N-acetyltransferase [Defluviitaleaceae bacterium]